MDHPRGGHDDYANVLAGAAADAVSRWEFPAVAPISILKVRSMAGGVPELQPLALVYRATDLTLVRRLRMSQESDKMP